jgi:hypothetical protein
MQEPYLEVTFRRGMPLAAYYYLPRRRSQRSYKTERVEAGIIIDFARGGRPIGLEITAPTKVTLVALNRVLRRLGEDTLTRADVAPLLAA